MEVMNFAEENGWKTGDLSLRWAEFLAEFRKAQEVKPSQEKLLEDFARMYGVEFVPVYSVVGSVASQEFIRVIGGNQEPGAGWFCYDSEEGYGKFEKTQ